MSPNIEVITEKLQLGESPFWEEKTQSLYFVDIFGKSVHRFVPSTKAYASAIVGDKYVSFIIPVEGKENTFLIGYGNEIAQIVWNGTSDKISHFETVVEFKNTPDKSHRWNDGKVAPSGKLWAGVMIPQEGGGFRSKAGGLYSLEADKTLKQLTSGITLTNGLAWDQNLQKFYYVDTGEDIIYQYDYAVETGKISNQQIIFKFSSNGIAGRPDGMTLDSNGNLWIASFGGGKLVNIDPRKPNTLIQTIDIPAEQVTCAEFGGPNYDELFVTTAGIPYEGKQHEGGQTYRITGLGVSGFSARKVKL